MKKCRKTYVFFLIIVFILSCGILKSQNITNQSSNQIPVENSLSQEFFIGIDTGTSNNFLDILENIRNTKGINVLSYCERNNIIKLTFNKENFDELVSIFDLIENSSREVICYHMKHYTNESYNEMCYEELVKRNTGGTE